VKSPKNLIKAVDQNVQNAEMQYSQNKGSHLERKKLKRPINQSLQFNGHVFEDENLVVQKNKQEGLLPNLNYLRLPSAQKPPDSSQEKSKYYLDLKGQMSEYFLKKQMINQKSKMELLEESRNLSVQRIKQSMALENKDYEEKKHFVAETQNKQKERQAARAQPPQAEYVYYVSNMIECLKKKSKQQQFVLEHFQMTMQALSYAKFLHGVKQSVLNAKKKTLARRPEHLSNSIKQTGRRWCWTWTRR